jgi:tRNA pseudouridine38-40 synthase
VHATGQVVHFDSEIDRGEKAWIMGTNSQLPPQIRVQWAKGGGQPAISTPVIRRHSRRYRYVIYDEPVKPTVLIGQLTHVRQRVNADVMHQAAQHLLGRK